jgi:hypothetical protein
MTRTELYTRTLQKLGTLAAGEVASADDAALIQTKYGSLYEQLQTLGLVAWAATEDIPEYLAEPIVQMVAALNVDEFEITDPKRSTLLLGGMLHLNPPSQAENVLRKQLARNYVSSPATPDYF